MTSVLKKSRGTKGKSESMQEDLPARWESNSQVKKDEDVAKIIKYIDDNVIGKGNSFCGPFGRRKVVYCDYSGSGRGLHWLEQYVSSEVLPTHATPCTALSYTSGQSDFYKSETKEIIRGAVGASSDDVVVLGASLSRFLGCLKPQRAVVFVSSRETERQIAPWKEFNTEVIKIPESKEGFIDLTSLELRLQENSGTGKRMIGFFPAASKVTGVLADDVATTLLLHQYGAWSFWDFTLVAPSAAVDMNPTFPGVEEQMVKKDAVFFNCEKFVGGVQGPYVAAFKKDIFRNNPIYCDDREVLSERIEEWRSSDGVRGALVMKLRDAVGLQNIAERQDRITRQVLSHIKNIPELILLGSHSATVRRLPIFSLLVKHPRGTFLHHNFVCAVLNDVFGIQARGGLSNNLNYGQDVLGIDEQLLKEYEKLLDVEGQKELARVRQLSNAKGVETPINNEHLRPGFSRISLPYFMSDSEIAFVLEALKMVATEGWKILPQYVVNPQTGQWRHHTCSVLRDRKSLQALRFHDGTINTSERRVSGPGIFPQTYTECLQTARNLFNKSRKLAMKCAIEPDTGFNPRIDYLRWFMLPKEAHDLLLGKSANVKHIVPFDPSGYTGARKSLQAARCGITSSPVLGCSPRHFSLTALDDCQIYRFKQKQKFYSRESSLRDVVLNEEVATAKRNPVKFAIGESVSPVHLNPMSTQPVLIRSRCYSLGSDVPAPELSIEAIMNLGLKETSPCAVVKAASRLCNCGSQTDLLSLDDPMISPEKAFPYSAQSSTSISDCSQTGRTSPANSVTSHTSEDLQAYVKEMTMEIATEIKSEIRGVISRVDDILDNTDSAEQYNNVSLNSISSQSDRNSVSITDVAEYLMGMSREMASEVKHEIREMVNQVDEMISPDYGSGSRRNSPPNSTRRRYGSGPDLGLNFNSKQALRKCPTSPVLPTHFDEDKCPFSRKSPCFSAKTSQISPGRESSGPNSGSLFFNSSETSTPDTIIHVATSSPNFATSSSSNKLSDEEFCNDATCRHCSFKKYWCQNPSVSSQDSGINLSFGENDSYSEFVKMRTSSDPTTNKCRKNRLRIAQKYEKSEVPDIIEGVPVCSSELTRYKKSENSEPNRVYFNIPGDKEAYGTSECAVESKRQIRSSNTSSSSHRSSRSSGYGTDHNVFRDDSEFDRSDDCFLKPECRWQETEQDDTSVSDSSLTEYSCDDEGKWHRPHKALWKNTVEAIHAYKMIRPGDKVLVCLSGGKESVALLHTLHQYQFYARSKGIHFSIGALFVYEAKSEVDPFHLMAYCRNLNVKLIYQDKTEGDDERRGSSASEWCGWASHGVRRRAYGAGAAQGYGVVAVAQHLDHAARAFLTAATHLGRLQTLKAHYRVREHNIRIIRPFIYVREHDIDAFATARMLPDFRNDANMAEINVRRERSPENSDESGSDNNKDNSGNEASACGEQDKPTPDRSQSNVAGRTFECAREMLAQQERIHPHLFVSLKNALHPLISARNIEKDLKEHRHRKKSVIQMKNGAPVYDSDEGTEEEPV